MSTLPRCFLLLPDRLGPFASIRRKRILFLIRQLLQNRLPEPLNSLQDLLQQLLKQQPKRLMAILEHVQCSAALHLLPYQTEALQDLVPTLLAAFPHLPQEFHWSLPVSHFVDLQTKRVIHFSQPAQGFVHDSTSMEFLLANGQSCALKDLADQPSITVSQPFHQLFNSSIHFSLYDNNPLSMLEAHPDKAGNRVDLGEKDISQWTQQLEEAGSLIKLALPEWWAEFPASLQRIVPVGFEQQKHLSASYQEVIGLAYVSLHPDPLIMAEAIIHETQHNKLNTLLCLDKVLINGNSEWTTSPVRPDMRPLRGVLLAAHAFVPVAAMHLRLQRANHPLASSRSFQHRQQQVQRSNQDAIETLREKSKPTPMGSRLLNDLFALHEAISAATQQTQHHPK